MWKFINIRRHPPEPYNEEDDSRHLYLSVFLPLLLVAVIWLVKGYELATGSHLGFLGVLPRTVQGLPGILLSPLIHSDVDHAFSNSVPLLVLGFLMYMSYRKVAIRTFLFIWLLEGILLWLIGRSSSYHIGASGVVYGMVFFLFFSGIFRLDMRSLALALLVAFAYGSLVWGVFPWITPPDMSWEAHLGGAIAGFLSAWIYRAVDAAPEVSWEEDEMETGESTWRNDRMDEPAMLRRASAQRKTVPVRYIYREGGSTRSGPADRQHESGNSDTAGEQPATSAD